ncbi:hypothetical protein K504DRAFT_537141 [Pleomassaria siparia CBS 279.74]|uniref:Uncharacterized protein n=1 Tax=Pleomassaria siparia CBS 279.74 TaxID=1314801 RepID=A0A6G1JZ01_9PLEO|nr:hypothetical protein K504DRAFT_537141 [Pleomassaria siparia CBS 279.74]
MYAIPAIARNTRARIHFNELSRTIGRRQYASTTGEATKRSSRIPLIFSASLITAGGAYYLGRQPSDATSNTKDNDMLHKVIGTQNQDKDAKSSSKKEEPAVIPSHPGGVQAEKNRRRAEYEDDHPKPVDDRHGDSVKKHSIAAEKNQNKVRIGKFSKQEFDNHIQKHSPDPCGDFEKVESKKKEEGKK